MTKTIAIFAGAGIGAVLGLFIGMSITSVVGLVVGGVSSVLVALLGFKNTDNNELQALSVGAFGFSCVAFCLAGVFFFRAQDVFALSMGNELKKWTTDSVFTKEEAKRYVLYERLGIIPEGVEINLAKKVDKTSVLYSADVTRDDCLDADRFKDFPIENELKSYRRLGGIWTKIADSVSIGVEAKNQKRILHLIKNCLCDE